MYADGWSSCDEEGVCVFVIWHGRRKTFFRREVDDHDENSRKVGGGTRLNGGGGPSTSSATDEATREGLRSKGKSKSKSVVKKVSSLGVQGKSMVFKTRSRAERDHWVQSIGLEIERLSSGLGSEVRLT